MRAVAEARKKTAAVTPRVGFISLGCPKALVDSERILTQLRADGYEVVSSYEDADIVVVNTCGFIDSAREESFDAIGEALSENGRVIVTGCLGAREGDIRARHPGVLSVTGPQQYEQVMRAVHEHLPPPERRDPFTGLLPPTGVKLTPRHYAYLKIAEGCNHRCSFCIIPSLRGPLASRPLGEVMREAENLVQAGVRELLVISQDTSAYGSDLRGAQDHWRGRSLHSDFFSLCSELGTLGVWVRLHYVYPYPHVDRVIPLMADGRLLPYLDVPFQHGSPRLLRLMRRPAATQDTLERIVEWRRICPELAIRSTFIVGFPGETGADFNELLEFIRAAKLDRVGCFMYSPVDGAAANRLPNPVPEELKQERWERFMQVQVEISARKTREKIGRVLDVLVDEAGSGGAAGRSKADAPEIDGKVTIHTSTPLARGDFVRVRITGADEYDLSGEMVS
ncbi:MAG: 30S ribosomal protein S12 methylthiotransferase RimO [Gammaproteobacteria bacterium]|nr:30S ribosomal protein S12 methylthiotransferase RimO [Gammaproteobacteria bacterium]